MFATRNPSRLLALAACCCLSLAIAGQLPVRSAAGQLLGRPQANRLASRSRYVGPLLKDVYYEDNRRVVRIKTTYNSSASVSCNGILMDPLLVLSDVSCIKYHGMANIDAKYVQVITGEPGQEETHEVEQIFINKANPNDPSTELALLKLRRPANVDNVCVSISTPQLNYTMVPDSPVRVTGYMKDTFELKENRTKISRRLPSNADKYICTLPSEDTPGNYLLKGAPLLAPVDCKSFHLIGILTRVDTFQDVGVKRQDCYVMVGAQIRWYNQVKSLATLTAKNDNSEAPQPSVVVVTVED